MSRIYNESFLLKKLGKPLDIEKKLVSVKTPFEFSLAWDTKAKISKIRSNKICSMELDFALWEIVNNINYSDLQKIGFNLFGGGFNIRNMRGSSTLSAHAFGIAFDFSPELNGLNTKYQNSSMNTPPGKKVCAIFKKHGFLNYGEVFGYDAMHFEFIKI
jgi:hypothetical protein